MFVLHALILLAGFAVCLKILPKNEWQSATFICFCLLMMALTAESTADSVGAAGRGHGAHMFWVIFFGIGLSCGWIMCRDLLEKLRRWR